MTDPQTMQPPQAASAAVVGVSEGRTCGVHDYAVLLSAALRHENVSCSEHWLWRSEDSIGGARSEFQGWTRALAAELDAAKPSAVILHYSVFAYSYRGFPLFVRPTLSALRGSGIPLITVMHEFVYPWTLGGLHGKAWAVTQGALLVSVMRASAAMLVTAPFRAEWLAAQPWLARREVAFAPVFSNLPAPDLEQPQPHGEEHVIGLFGYAYEGAAASLVLDAVRLLHDRGLRVRLALLGAPGRGTAAADAWLAGARTRGIEQALSFSGVLSAQALANELRACDVLLHPEPSGPTSRKGTLAASLASGSAVVAIDGPRRWPELIESEAALVVSPTAGALADGLAGLLEDERRREELGVRGGEFARRAMGVERSARVLAGLIEKLAGDPG
jgi:glycosyltransferase involved in cell wall biosynthesis